MMCVLQVIHTSYFSIHIRIQSCIQSKLLFFLEEEIKGQFFSVPNDFFNMQPINF